jgi:hypothetical protein
VAFPARLPVAAQSSTDLDPQIVRLLSGISEERLAATLRKLGSFGTRNTLSSTDLPDRGIGAARQWLFDEMKGYSPRLQVGFDAYKLAAQARVLRDNVDLRNIVAILPGRSARRIYISAHYDTTVLPQYQVRDFERPDPPKIDRQAPLDDPAPGVNDDGSGTALTLELARVFSQSGLEFDATLVFICHAGEEQGLIGAHLHAEKAKAEKMPIAAVLNNDIVGNDRGGNGIIDGASVRVYSEGPEDSPSRSLARYVQRWGMRYVPSHAIRLMARRDRFQRGGDHSAYNDAGFAAVGFRESRENFARQHRPEDTFEGVSPAYLAQNARVNASVAASLALAPPSPQLKRIDREPSGYDAHLSWEPAAGAVAYRIFWREVWGPDWQHELAVGNVTDFVMKNTIIDDYVFGVAAVDAAGHESVVSPFVETPRNDPPVRTLP